MRPLWSGTVSFGLVNVPIALYSAVKEENVHFHLLSKDGTCRLRRKLFCPETGKEYEYSETTRGYEIAPEQYVVMEPEELEELEPEKSKTLEITQFIKLEEIDPLYFRQPYFVAPGARAERAFTLLRQALLKSGRVAIGKFVMREREYLCALRPYEEQNLIILETMHFSSEIVSPEEMTVPEKEAKVSKEELDLALRLVEQSTTAFKPERYKDEYQTKLRALIEKRAASPKKGRVSQGKKTAAKREEKIIDLAEALKRSLAQKRKGGGPGKKAA